MGTNENSKQMAAQVALEYIKHDMTVGIGTGSTVNCLIRELMKVKNRFKQLVSSSEATTIQLKALGFEVNELNSVDRIDLYIDGADEINPQMMMIKGGGGALTREKIIAQMAKKFVCIADASKQVDVLGKFPLPIEVIPMARSYIARALVQMGGQPVYREQFVTDNGMQILDVHNLSILNPLEMERTINSMPGVVTCGLFAKRGSDVLIIGDEAGAKEITRKSDCLGG